MEELLDDWTVVMVWNVGRPEGWRQNLTGAEVRSTTCPPCVMCHVSCPYLVFFTLTAD